MVCPRNHRSQGWLLLVRQPRVARDVNHEVIHDGSGGMNDFANLWFFPLIVHPF